MPKELIAFISDTAACDKLKRELERQSALRELPVRYVPMKATHAGDFNKNGVRSAPTLICVDGDKEIARLVGAHTGNGIENFIKECGI